MLQCVRKPRCKISPSGLLSNNNKCLREFPAICPSQASATLAALLCTTTSSPSPLISPAPSLPSAEHTRLTRWTLRHTNTSLAGGQSRLGTRRSDSPLCPRSEAFNPVQMECMAFRATKWWPRGGTRVASAANLLDERFGVLPALFLMTVMGPAAVLWMRRRVEVHLAASHRLGGWWGGVLSHFWLRHCQRDLFPDIS